jgi:integrase/recombinase XerC
MAPFFVLEKFINYLQVEKRYSDHTVIAYNKDVLQFIEFSEITNIEEFKEIRSNLIRSWIVSLIENLIENKSVNRKLSSLRTFFKWLKKEQYIELNPLLKISGPKQVKRLPSFAKESELSVEKTEQYFSQDFDGIRDRLIVEFFYQTGIRLSELINLKDKDIQAQSIKVLGKRNKERIIPISNGLFDLVNEYRKAKKELSLSSDVFFVLINGNNLYPKFVYRKINIYLGNATSLDKCSPHVLRHTFATHMLNNGAGLETLKDILGHANLSATQIYTHNSFAKLTNIYSQAHPRGRKTN